MAILSKAALFGLCWLVDGATIKKMPLNYMLVMCSDKQPVISICDCTNHMVDGGKKDAEFIMNVFKTKIEKFEITKVYTDSFFIDKSANMKKAGQILCAHFPWAMCFHGESMYCHYFSVIFQGLVL